MSGTQDTDPIGEAVEIIHGVSIGGKSYPARSLTVHVRDDDTGPGLTLTHADFGGGVVYDGQLSLTEGSGDTYTAVLASEPAADVVVALSSSDLAVVTVDPATLTFTTQNWYTGQPVTLTTLSDDDVYHEREFVSHEVVIGGVNYVIAQVAARVTDLDLPQLTFTSDGASVSEGETATYTVALASQPAAEVQVLLVSADDDAARAWPRRLTFTTIDWSTAQTVTVTGVLDDDDRDEAVRIGHAAVIDGDIHILEVQTVAVTDQDLPALALSADSVDIVEGKSTDYMVALAEQPAAALTVTLTSSDLGALTVSPLSLSFATDTRNTAQTVTVTGLQDGDTLDEDVDVRHGATIGGKTYVRATLTALVTDAVSAPSFTEGSAATRSVAEDAPAGTRVGAAVAATDSDGDSVTYTLGGTDAASFDIIESSGQLRTRTALNHEAKDTYAATVTATDPPGFSNAIDVTVSIGNVDEAGTVSFAQIGDTVTATVSDPDGGVHSEAWQWDRSSNRGRGWTDIVNATSASYTPVDDDQGMYLRARAPYVDAHGAGKGAQGVSASQIAPPDLRVATLVSGLSIPWDIAFTPDGTMLFTQRAGVLSSRLIDGTVQTITADLSDLFANGETGFVGIVVDPRFSSNCRFYTCQGHTGPEVQVIAWTINADYTAATRVAYPLVGGMPASSGRHGGCRLRFGPNGYLWISTGDASTGTVSQDLTSLGGKVLRVNASTGAGAPTNSLAPSPVYTYGHRNPQGLARRPGTSQMWSVEHGPTGDDEINLLIAGGNYGWDPVSGYNESVP